MKPKYEEADINDFKERMRSIQRNAPDLRRSLYNKYEAMTTEGQFLSDELEKALDEIITKWHNYHLKLREIHSIATMVLTNIIAEKALVTATKMRRADKELENILCLLEKKPTT